LKRQDTPAHESVEETKRKVSLLPERFRMNDMKVIEHISEEGSSCSQSSITSSSCSSDESPLDLSKIDEKDKRRMQKEAKLPLNQMRRNVMR